MIHSKSIKEKKKSTSRGHLFKENWRPISLQLLTFNSSSPRNGPSCPPLPSISGLCLLWHTLWVQMYVYGCPVVPRKHSLVVVFTHMWKVNYLILNRSKSKKKSKDKMVNILRKAKLETQSKKQNKYKWCSQSCSEKHSSKCLYSLLNNIWKKAA